MIHFQNIKISSLFGTISLALFLIVIVFLIFPIPQANAHTACSNGVCINLKVNGSESPVTVDADDFVTLSWTSSGATGGCMAISSYGNWSAGDGYTKPLNNTGWNVGPINSSGNVQIICLSAVGGGASHSSTINVATAGSCTSDSACSSGEICDVDGTCKFCPGAGPGAGPCVADSQCGGGNLCDITNSCRSCGTGSCTDSDGDSGSLGTPFTSLNITTAGVCKDSGGITYLDSCSGGTLTEYFCLGSGSCSSVGGTCPSGFECIAGTGKCSAVGGGGGTGGGLLPACGTATDPCTFCHLLQLLSNIINFAIFTIAPLLAILMISIGGFMMIVSRGNPGQFGKGKSYITWAFIGYGIVLLAWVIVNLVLTFIGVASWVGIGGWWTLAC